MIGHIFNTWISDDFCMMRVFLMLDWRNNIDGHPWREAMTWSLINSYVTIFFSNCHDVFYRHCAEITTSDGYLMASIGFKIYKFKNSSKRDHPKSSPDKPGCCFLDDRVFLIRSKGLHLGLVLEVTPLIPEPLPFQDLPDWWTKYIRALTRTLKLLLFRLTPIS